MVNIRLSVRALNNKMLKVKNLHSSVISQTQSLLPGWKLKISMKGGGNPSVTSHPQVKLPYRGLSIYCTQVQTGLFLLWMLMKLCTWSFEVVMQDIFR